MNIRGRLERIEAGIAAIADAQPAEDPYLTWQMGMIPAVYGSADLDQLRRELERLGPEPEPTTQNGYESRRSVRVGWGEDRGLLRCVLSAKTGKDFSRIDLSGIYKAEYGANV